MGRRIADKGRVSKKGELFLFLEEYVFLSRGLPSMTKGEIVE
jgi:hypothetical protein